MGGRKRQVDLLKRRARVAIQSGRVEQASASLTDACRREPCDAEAWFLLGAVHGQAGKIPEAIDCARHAIALRPDYPDAYYNLGQAYTHQGKYEDAITSYRQAIRYRPDFAEAGNHLAYALLQSGQPAEALSWLQRVLQERPDYAQAHNNLGIARLDIGREHAAADSFRMALRLQPDFLSAHRNLARTLTHQGHPEGALELCDKILRSDPGDLETRAIKAEAFDRLGCYSEAYELFRPLLESRAQHSGAAMAFARFAHHVDRLDEATNWLETILAAETPGRQELAQVHFALGRLHDRRQAFDQAFFHFQRGNEIKRASLPPCAPGQWRREIDAIISAFDANSLAQLPHATNRSAVPVFIVGMPRSGTSLVEQILASHPAVYGGGERTEIADLVDRLPRYVRPERPYPECIAHLGAEHLQELARDELARLLRLAPNAQRITDKMPNNFLCLGLIQLLFPGARIIHCVRDPRDTCLSCYFQLFSGRHPYAYDLEQLGVYYLEYRRLMTHWHRVLDLPILELRYEDLVEHPEYTSRSLIEFCDLPWKECCLRFHESKRVVSTISYDQVRHPIYRGSLERWRNYEEYLSPLFRALDPGGPECPVRIASADRPA